MSAYVYAIVVDGIVRYIGKGSGSRVGDHVLRAARINRLRESGQKVRARHFYNSLAKAIRDGRHVKEEILKDCLSNEQAYSLEIELIDSLVGLWNTRRGGEGGAPSESVKAKISESVHSNWRDPAIVARRMAAMSNPQVKKVQSEKSKRAWADPVVRVRRIEGQRAAHKRPEVRARKIEVMRGRWADESNRKKASDRLKAMHQDPAYRAALSENLKRGWVKRKARAA